MAWGRRGAVLLLGAALASGATGSDGRQGALVAPAAPESREGPAVVYPPVVPGRPLRFPDDTGAHPSFRNEWWYVTGWLRDESGVERGFQVTFFRVRTGLGEDNPSRFAPSQLVFAHAAVADAGHGRLMHAQRSARALAPLVAAEAGHTGVHIGDWSLAWRSDRYRTRVSTNDFAFDFDLAPTASPMVNGEAGFSRKDADPKHASYYYSRPQLRVGGELRLSGRSSRVEGRAWLDHEWSSELMPPQARGWDWIGINLADGGALMAFRMRDAAGATRWAGGTLRTPGGEQRTLGPHEIRFLAGRRWRSPRSGIDYPVEWTVELDHAGGTRRLQLVPLMDDQELDSRASTGAIYWEGAVRAYEDSREAGRGYLEMTGYGERPPL